MENLLYPKHRIRNPYKNESRHLLDCAYIRCKNRQSVTQNVLLLSIRVNMSRFMHRMEFIQRGLLKVQSAEHIAGGTHHLQSGGT